jgi:hypothetical protein
MFGVRRWLAVVGFVGLAACGSGLAPTARLGEGGVVPNVLSVRSAGTLHFVNADGRAHQIYSNDCPEVASSLMNPGSEGTTTVGEGPKVCHFGDRLSADAPAYTGTVEVKGDYTSLDFYP